MAKLKRKSSKITEPKVKKEKKSKLSKKNKSKEPKPDKKESRRQKKKKNKQDSGVKATFSYKKLNKQIKGWGYEYSPTKFFITMLLVLAGMAIMCYFFKLMLMPKIITSDSSAMDVYYMSHYFPYAIFVIFTALAVVPIIILAQFAFIGNNDKFEQIVNYLEPMILSFKRNPKILSAMQEAYELSSGNMKVCIGRAINIIQNDTESEHVYQKAFKVIEDEFKCSRIKTLHRFMLNVEMESSTNYQNSIDNLYTDIRAWVTRTYKYQAELKATKSKIMIILGLSLGISAFFTQMLRRAENSTNTPQMLEGGLHPLNIINTPVYQISTTIFIITFIIIYTILNTKVNGFWLVNDIAEGDEELLLQKIEEVENFNAKSSRKVAIIIAIAFFAIFAIIGLLKSKILIILGLVVGGVIVFFPNLVQNANKKSIERELSKEFPIWLRDIAVNLNNMVVVRAIVESYPTAAPILKPFIERFVRRSEEDPTSITPYTDFLGVFTVSEISTAMKMLYAIKMLSAEESSRQVNELIDRNQELLEGAERMRQEDSIAGVSFISLAPMLLMSIKLMIDLAVMLAQFMSLASGAL